MVECYECGKEIDSDFCAECGVDHNGNTEDEIINCCFPDCGCDGVRLCMAKNGASDRANRQNVEGMWNRNKIRDPVERWRARKAVADLYSDVIKGI